MACGSLDINGDQMATHGFRAPYQRLATCAFWLLSAHARILSSIYAKSATLAIYIEEILRHTYPSLQGSLERAPDIVQAL